MCDVPLTIFEFFLSSLLTQLPVFIVIFIDYRLVTIFLKDFLSAYRATRGGELVVSHGFMLLYRNYSISCSKSAPEVGGKEENGGSESKICILRINLVTKFSSQGYKFAFEVRQFLSCQGLAKVIIIDNIGLVNGL